MAAKYAWIFQILIFTHLSINWVPINTYKWYWVYNGPNWENIGPQSHLFKKSPILLWKTGPYISTFASRHGRTKRRTDLKFWIFPFDYKGNIWAKWEENPRGSCGNFSENLVISYGMTQICLVYSVSNHRIFATVVATNMVLVLIYSLTILLYFEYSSSMYQLV